MSFAELIGICFTQFNEGKYSSDQTFTLTHGLEFPADSYKSLMNYPKQKIAELCVGGGCNKNNVFSISQLSSIAYGDPWSESNKSISPIET